MADSATRVLDDHRFMAQALMLAREGIYSTAPNPAVGCVIVKDGLCVGEGYHRRAGEAHAEVNALRAAGPAARGATAYVTLEPCNHQGRTPPCTNALIAAGIKRVVFAAGDPNPNVAGCGALVLENAGIDVTCKVLEGEALALNRGFHRRIETGRPFVVVKSAMSLDAKIALSTGESKWITSPQARADVQRLRARSSAIITGRATVVADDPRLDVRDARFDTRGRQPLRVVLDSDLQLAADHNIFKPPGRAMIVTTRNVAEKTSESANANITVEQLPAKSGRVDLDALVSRLAEIECNEILVEAGPTLVSAFLDERLCDELVVYIAPKIIGTSAKEGLPLPSIERLQEAFALEFTSVTHVGEDIRIVARPVRT